MYTLNRYLESVGAYYVGELYDDDTFACYVGDWNRIFPNRGTEEVRHNNIYNLSRLERLAREKGINLRYHDDYITDNQGRVHETTPQYHGWTPTYRVLGDCEVWAEDEVNESTLDDYAERLVDSTTPDLWHTDFEPLGFRKLEKGYETGFHHGQNDNPEEVLRELNGKGYEVIFSVEDKGQFDVHWSVWVRKGV